MAGKAALRIFQKTWRSASSRATRTSLQPAFSHSSPTWSKVASSSACGPSSSTSSAAPASSGQPAWAIASEAPIVRLSIISMAPGTTPGRDDGRHRVPGVPGRLEEGHERAHRLGRGHDADGDLRRHAERALRADEDAAQVVAGQVELLAAQLDDRAVGQHDLQAADVVRGEAVLEAVRAAGVLGHVAADRAHDLRRRVGRVEVRGPDRGRDGDVRHPGLADDALVLEVDLEDAAQPREHDEHAVLERQRPARQAAARAARHPRHARRVAGAHDGGHLLAGAGQHGRARHGRVLQQPVGLVGAQRVVLGDDVLVAADAPQLLDQLHADHHPREDAGALQVDDHHHRRQQDQAPFHHPTEQVAFLASHADRGRADGEVLGRDHLAQHAAAGVRGGHQHGREVGLLGGRHLQRAEQRVGRRVRAGDRDARASRGSARAGRTRRRRRPASCRS